MSKGGPAVRPSYDPTHRSGGAVEIVNRDTRLIYENREETPAKIRRVMQSPEQQRALRAALAKRAAIFTPEAFMQGIRKIVGERLCATAPPGVIPDRAGQNENSSRAKA